MDDESAKERNLLQKLLARVANENKAMKEAMLEKTAALEKENKATKEKAEALEKENKTMKEKTEALEKESKAMKEAILKKTAALDRELDLLKQQRDTVFSQRNTDSGWITQQAVPLLNQNINIDKGTENNPAIEGFEDELMSNNDDDGHDNGKQQKEKSKNGKTSLHF